ncbi:protein-disulfide reductase DsbD domain-containing protein [uncultured Tateyamaria sp.]|uniref:protein-disulfide reductase DsbD domain-containing protein n=1 Tax=Tateyamaria sp. 1078 TaxID=3417464 RepID=UPI0026050261|nr:protein-disulfide reductase DsbD domain-containing protein [uncultured Tateyamaria sp.]
MTRLNRLLSGAALAALTALPMPASAGDFDPVTAEVLQGWTLPDGRRVAAVRLTLEPGWKTYWRAPGDAGIPPHFDWSRARNIADVDVSWPTPSVYHQNGMRSLGYTGQVVLPMHITPKRSGAPVRLRTKMSIGVCAEVCVPHTLHIDAMLDSADLSPTPAIVAALSDMPYAADEAGVVSAACRMAPTEHGMSIEAHVTLPHTGGTEVAVIEPGTPGVWVSEARTARQGDTVVAVSEMIHPDGGAFSIDRSNVRITILGGDYAVDIQGCTAAG